ncbi:2-ketogluconate utilization repressor PtxS [Klebsiella pneumoniae]|nr:2-ketogluconate utilization repressor PtxS [Klebsiella pneumoniae]
MPAFEWVHVQLHQQKGMISLSPPTICNSAGITTLKQPTWQIGYAAVEQVIRRIAGTNDPIRERVFSGELIVRGSTSR